MPAVRILLRHGRRPVGFAARQYRPCNPCGLVGHYGGGDPRRFACQERPDPDPGWRRVDLCTADHGCGADNEQSSQGAIPHFRDTPEPVLAARQVLGRGFEVAQGTFGHFLTLSCRTGRLKVFVLTTPKTVPVRATWMGKWMDKITYDLENWKIINGLIGKIWRCGQSDTNWSR